jgi:hypothetical protein
MRRVRESTYIRARTICIHTQITPQPSRRKRRSLKRDRLRFVSAVWYERAGHRKNSIVGGERIDIVNTVFRILSRVATTMDCGPCRVKAKCCPKSPQRRIPPSIYEDARDFPRSLCWDRSLRTLPARSKACRDAVRSPQAHPKAWPSQVAWAYTAPKTNSPFGRLLRIFGASPNLLPDRRRVRRVSARADA